MLRRSPLAALALLPACTLTPSPPESEQAFATLTGAPPLVIAHRGASGELPEHTLPAFIRAIEQGADAIEPDLVMTKDGHLVVRHDRYLSTTTDVAERAEFADRLTSRDSQGFPREDWWVEDFTLAELKSLRALQPVEGRDQSYNSAYPVATLSEVVALAKMYSAEQGRAILVVPEAKAPAAHKAAGLDMADAIADALVKYGWLGPDAPVVIQSFDQRFLSELDQRTAVPLLQLVYPGPDGVPSVSLKHAAGYADAIGASKALIVDDAGLPTDYLARAHRFGLPVHAWTFRDDQPPADGANIQVELRRIYDHGVDGVFADFPATAIAARDALTLRDSALGLVDRVQAGEFASGKTKNRQSVD